MSGASTNAARRIDETGAPTDASADVSAPLFPEGSSTDEAPVNPPENDAPFNRAARPLARKKTGERRNSGDRNSAKNEASMKAEFDEPRFFIPRNWYLISVFLFAGMLISSITTLAFPPVAIAGQALAALGLTALGNWLAKLERREGASLATRIALLLVAVGAPMFLAGIVISQWVFVGNLNPYWGVGGIVTLTTLSAVLLFKRFVAQTVSIISCWGGAVLAAADLMAAAALALFTLMLGFTSWMRVREEGIAEEKRQARERIQNRAEDILRDYEETGQGWFWETDRRGQLTYLTDGVARTLGREKNELLTRPLAELFELDYENREGERTLAFHLSARSSFAELPVRAASADEERWWSINGRPVYDSFRNFVGFRGSGMDLTEKRRSQEKASRLAHYDSLTGLANRFQMSQLLEKILNSPQESERECAVFLLDLDRFKNVNDTLGHPVGDELLKQVAQRLERAVGRAGRVGRLGGDEFKVIIPGRVPRERLGDIAQQMIHSASEPYALAGQRVVIGASIGIAICPADGVTSESLIRNSDLALYAAKDGGRGRYHFYANDLHSAAEERSEMEQDLRAAVAEGSFELFYQPTVSTASENITGFEALLRWKHPKKGWISPAKFIPIAEDTGLITAIGDWALRTACHDLANWPEQVRCAVNVSPLQFANPDLPTVVTNALAHAGVNPERLELEITESVFLNDDENTDSMFAALKRVGVRLALDDFGTGYSSLGYLKKAPFDKIKIDQSFVRGATQPGSRNGAIITSITSLAKALGMDTTAEGVETLDELELVRELGCSHVQGYIYEKPLSLSATNARLAQGLEAHASGPRSARAPRQTMLRKVVLQHGGQYYNGTIRNISITGALVEGLWNVPPGTIFKIALSETFIVTATSRWSHEDKTGMEFSVPLEQDESGKIIALSGEGGNVMQRAGAA